VPRAVDQPFNHRPDHAAPIARRVVSSQEREIARSYEVMAWWVLVVVMRVGFSGLRCFWGRARRFGPVLPSSVTQRSRHDGSIQVIVPAAVWIWVRAPGKGITLIFQAHGGE
jgi:hypothetical protein